MKTMTEKVPRTPAGLSFCDLLLHYRAYRPLP